MTYSDWKLEKELWQEKYNFIVGIDEAGRGPWAGPVVAGAVCFKSGFEKDLKLRDSKKISEKGREELYQIIIEESLGFGTGIIEAKIIDKVGIVKAVYMAMTNALHQVEKMLGERAQFLIIDGANVREILGYKQKRINKGDVLHCSISAGSIIAKVTRDRIMNEYAKKYPEYGFERHKAYGTKIHKESLLKYGPTEIHRFSYKPVAEIASKFGKNRRGLSM